jgi:hypothetical protein
VARTSPGHDGGVASHNTRSATKMTR